MKKATLTIAMLTLLAAVHAAQTNYSYSAQKGFIHKELGKVYLGMPFRELADEMVLNKAVVGDTRFDWLELTIPVNGKDIESVRMRIHGLSREEKAGMIMSETASGGEEGYDEDIDRIVVGKIPADHGFVYSMYVNFKPEFDLKSYAVKIFGKEGEVRKDDDPYHFFDIQWTKTSSDGLDWLIRSFHLGDKRELQLLGRIPDTEWDAS